ncbi:MAG: acyltransferase [Lactobacillaceae bacterium]|jgi:hypothetical protein|nr:acyltransferase [Lactobacillaceae bacterium]
MASQNNRDSRFELLRMLAMVLIITHHLLLYSPQAHSLMQSSVLINRYLEIYFSIPGKAGVALFVMLSGYYLAKFNWRFSKLTNLWKPVIVYSLVFTGLQFATHGLPVNWQNILAGFFPILTNKWWFITSFAGLLIVSQPLRQAFEQITRLQRLLWFSGINLCISILIYGQLIPANGELLKLVGIALMGWSIHDYTDVFLRYATRTLMLCGIILAGLVSWCIISPNFIKGTHLGWPFQPTPVVSMTSSVFAILLFIICIVGIKPFQNTFINKVGGMTLAVYLIHDSDFMREHMWKLLPTKLLYNSPWFVGYVIVLAFCIFVVCTLIELFRLQLTQFITTKWRRRHG